MTTSTETITREQAQAIALLIHRLRGWDIPGIMAALRRAAGMATDAYELARVAIAVAENPAARTPALIAEVGPHWHTRPRSSPTPPRRTPCDEPGHTGDVVSCPECDAAVADPETIARIRDQWRKNTP